MNSFDFSDNNYDQYYVDIESRYPLFSDVYGGEYEYNNEYNKDYNSEYNKDYNAITTRKTSKPTISENKSVITSSVEKIQHKISDNIQRKLSEGAQLKKVVESAAETFISNDNIQLDQNTIIFLVFVMIIFLFCMCFKMMAEMRSEIKLLRKLIKMKL